MPRLLPGHPVHPPEDSHPPALILMGHDPTAIGQYRPDLRHPQILAMQPYHITGAKQLQINYYCAGKTVLAWVECEL